MRRLVVLLLGGLVAPAQARDPFAAPASPEQPASPLERIEPDRLRLVGVILAPAPRALLRDDSGAVHRATIGTPVGPRGGAVTAIEPGRLRLREPGGADVVLALDGAGTTAP